MSELDKACQKLRALLSNPYAVERLERELSPHWEHPGWKDIQNKKVVRKCKKMKETRKETSAKI